MQHKSITKKQIDKTFPRFLIFFKFEWANHGAFIVFIN